ncbi:MAG: KipI family sensor histidine kinase inhibitor [Halioglobus sp.]|jgi:KipI family sensor histidine kinase inhibitor
MQLTTVGEDALMLYLGSEVSPEISAKVQACTNAIEQALGALLIDLVPSYASVLIIYDTALTNHLEVARQVRAAVQNLTLSNAEDSHTVVLPVYYAAETGDDLEALAEHAGLSIASLIELHTSIAYRVYAIGFAPGFAYLGEVDPRIAAPRLSTPRAHVPRGAVAIADRQTAVYPTASPGGWNLIGRCPVPMFDPNATPTMPMAVGDQVRFESISRDRYLTLGGELT